jgi:hypothetical protein
MENNENLTIEDQFAMSALQGLLANEASVRYLRENETIPGSWTDKVSTVAYWYARAMVRARKDADV